MGFDVLYFPPIHPIGHTNRKGRNNSVTSERRARCPLRDRSEVGGHKAVEPALGTVDDFLWLEDEFISAEWNSRSTSRSLFSRSSLRAGTSEWFYKRPDGRLSSPRIRQKIRRHLSAEFSVRQLARALGRDAGHHTFLGRTRSADCSCRYRTPTGGVLEFLISSVRANFRM